VNEPKSKEAKTEGREGKERMEDNRANTKMMKLTVLAGQVDGSGVHSPSSGAAVTRSLTERRERREERERRTRGIVRIGRKEGGGLGKLDERVEGLEGCRVGSSVCSTLLHLPLSPFDNLTERTAAHRGHV
jgi:hypothetical protein